MLGRIEESGQEEVKDVWGIRLCICRCVEAGLARWYMERVRGVEVVVGLGLGSIGFSSGLWKR